MFEKLYHKPNVICSKVSGVGYNLEGEITTEETYLNQGHLVEKDVVVDHTNHPGIRRIVEVRISLLLVI